MSTALTKSRPQTSTVGRNPLALLREEMDELIGRIWDDKSEGRWLVAPFEPSLDLIEEDNAFEMRIDVPGMEAKDIDVQVHGNTVTVSGKREEEKKEEGKEFHRVERRSGAFSRTLALPCKVNEDEVVAEYTQGVLTVKLPKCEEAKAKKINV